MGRRTIGSGVMLAGGVVGALWASGRVTHPFAPVFSLMLLTVGATFFSRVSQLAERLRPMVSRVAAVEVYGSSLPGVRGSVRVDKVMAVGAGLHFYLRSVPDGSSLHLKIAQPKDVTLTSDGFEVAQAKYIQWDGKMISGSPGKKPFALVLKSNLST